MTVRLSLKRSRKTQLPTSTEWVWRSYPSTFRTLPTTRTLSRISVSTTPQRSRRRLLSHALNQKRRSRSPRLRLRKKLMTLRSWLRPRSLRRTTNLLSVRLNSKRKLIHSLLSLTLLTRSRRKSSVSPSRFQRLTLISLHPKRTLSSRLAKQK